MDIEKQYYIELAIQDWNHRYELRKRFREQMRKINYGHKFDYNRRCGCGITQIDYSKIPSEKLEVCINYERN